VHHFINLTGSAGCVAYPVKANPSLDVLRKLATLGCSADCASPHEVQMSLAAGFPIKKIVYNSPVPSRSLAVRLLKQSATVVVDSESILADIEGKLCPSDCKGNILLRINPNVPVEYLHETDWQEMTAHASTMSKFGIPSENIVSVILASTLPIAGLHMHIGTQMDNMKAFVSALDFMHGLVDEIEAATVNRMDILDIGGGLGIHFLPGDEFPTLTDYAATLKSRFRKNRTYVVEPGHAIVGTAVGLLSCVQEIKTLRSRRWAILDVGTDQLIKVTLLSWRHQIKK
jgi:diaminopimelate decarboxylase